MNIYLPQKTLFEAIKNRKIWVHFGHDFRRYFKRRYREILDVIIKSMSESIWESIFRYFYDLKRSVLDSIWRVFQKAFREYLESI